MAEYRVSGIWINSDKVITHYAFHTVYEKSISKAIKTTKTEAIHLLEKIGNTATTWIWNYKKPGWNVGEKITIVNGEHGKFLRSNADDRLTDNLAHLMDYDWVFS